MQFCVPFCFAEDAPGITCQTSLDIPQGTKQKLLLLLLLRNLIGLNLLLSSIIFRYLQDILYTKKCYRGVI